MHTHAQTHAHAHVHTHTDTHRHHLFCQKPQTSSTFLGPHSLWRALSSPRREGSQHLRGSLLRGADSLSSESTLLSHPQLTCPPYRLLSETSAHGSISHTLPHASWKCLGRGSRALPRSRLHTGVKEKHPGSLASLPPHSQAQFREVLQCVFLSTTRVCS